MKKIIPIADAQRRFLELLREVEAAHSYVVTSRGQPVAKITPVIARSFTAIGSRSALLKRLKSQKVTATSRWKRDELYE